ncbi:MAG: GDCCVxC domain-containing (seleno)protein [Proteobacteria bacterium]|nr:GDCCVxC domain-containing (seleno)protein [Pseudomonadota bacterium]
MSEIVAESEITCPDCGHREVETMPRDACQFFYDCKGCGKVLRALPGDCCVFCSYGTAACPPIQARARENTNAKKIMPGPEGPAS